MSELSTRPGEIFPGWGKRIQLAREAASLSQEELAKRVPTSRNSISRWENEHHPVAVATWPALAGALSVRLEWLRDGKGEMALTPLETLGISKSLKPNPDSPIWQVGRSLGISIGRPRGTLGAHPSPTRQILEDVLMDDLHGLGDKITEMSDDEVAELAGAIRKALGKTKK